MAIFNQKVKFTVSEQIRFSRRVAALLGAGMSIAETFLFIERSMVGVKKKALAKIIESITQGRLCSEIFKEMNAFDRSLVHMIAIGEKSGSLERAFFEAALLLEKRQAISRKIYGALIYPGFIACATIGIALFLVVYIFPKIIPLITSMNIPLPFLTRVLIFISHNLIEHWFLIILILIVSCISAFVVWRYVRLVRRVAGIMCMSLPLIGSIFKSKILIQIFKPLGLLLGHGEHVPEALVSVAGIISLDEYVEVLQVGATVVTRGESFARYVSMQGHLFPQLVIDFLETGERTGGIATACEHIANLYESEVDESVKHISTIIEPALMLGMGIVVGGIALSIVMPIYEITSYLSK